MIRIILERALINVIINRRARTLPIVTKANAPNYFQIKSSEKLKSLIFIPSLFFIIIYFSVTILYLLLSSEFI